MKLRATKKEIKKGYYRIISAGYCDIQTLLRYENPFAYSAGGCGWCCDYYDIDGVCISTGYSPLTEKNSKRDFKVINKYEKKARKLQDTYTSYEKAKKASRRLIDAMIKELTA